MDSSSPDPEKKAKRQYGNVKEWVYTLRHMTARGIQEQTGYSIHSIYSAARAMGIKLKPAEKKL